MRKNQQKKGSLRSYNPEDMVEVSALIERCLREVNSKDYPSSTIELMLEEFSPANVKDWFSRMDTVVVLEDLNGLLGTGSLEGNRIRSVFVSPDHHGKGLGSQIMNHLEGVARENGATKVVLNSSLSSLKFYLGKGYVEVERVYQERGGDMIGMEKVL